MSATGPAGASRDFADIATTIALSRRALGTPLAADIVAVFEQFNHRHQRHP
jgi:hypothetical protein